METVKLTVNEIEVLKAIVAAGWHEGTQNHVVEDLVKCTGKSVNSIKSVLANLYKKGIIHYYDNEYVFDGNIIRKDAEEVVNSIINNVNSQNSKTENNMEENKNMIMDDRIVRMNEIAATKISSVSKGKRENLKAAKAAIKFITENWDDVEALIMLTLNPDMKIKCYELYCIAKSRIDQLSVETAETLKAVNNTPKTSVTKSKHEVGDLHPTEDWVWTEYKPGKFDWRTNKHDNPEVNRKEREDKSKPVKKSNKTKKQVEKPINVRSIEEILATKPHEISEPQERAFKLLRKGYRIDPNASTPRGYTLIKDNKTMVIMEAVMNALINRLKVTTDEIKSLYV